MLVIATIVPWWSKQRRTVPLKKRNVDLLLYYWYYCCYCYYWLILILVHIITYSRSSRQITLLHCCGSNFNSIDSVVILFTWLYRCFFIVFHWNWSLLLLFIIILLRTYSMFPHSYFPHYRVFSHSYSLLLSHWTILVKCCFTIFEVFLLLGLLVK